MSEDAYKAARRSIINNALRRQQKSLDLRNKRLTALPPEIGQLTGLQRLDLSGNQLTALPPEIVQLTGLQHLDLSGNQLTALTPGIGQLTKLQRPGHKGLIEIRAGPGRDVRAAKPTAIS
jgi:Leucine-rich repeat (LRR) protein